MGGYTFMKFVGVEASYRDMGGISETIGTTQFSTDTSSMEVFGVGILPLGKVDLFAKLGYAFIEVDATISDPLLPAPLSVSVDGEELAYGAGLNWGFGKFALRVEYEAFDTSDSASMFSAGALFKF